jgi:hypothetical protein
MNSVEQLRDRLDGGSQTLIVSTSPVYWQVLAPDQNPDLSRRYGVKGQQPVTDDIPFKVLSAWSRHTDVPLCAPIHAFRDFKSPKTLFCSDRPRLSKYGMQLYAEELTATVLRTPGAVASRLQDLR